MGTNDKDKEGPGVTMGMRKGGKNKERSKDGRGGNDDDGDEEEGGTNRRGEMTRKRRWRGGRK